MQSMTIKDECDCGFNPCDNPDKFEIHFSRFSPEFKLHGAKDYFESICKECGMIFKEKVKIDESLGCEQTTNLHVRQSNDNSTAQRRISF